MLYDVTIIGGGIVGSAIARELARYSLQVVLVEKECDVGFGSSKANSGIVHAGHHSPLRTVKGELEWAGNQMWDQLCSDLGIGIKRVGEFTVALDPLEIEILEQLKEQGQAKGVPGLEIWGRDRLLREEPYLTPAVQAALYAPTSGVINPYEACIALVDSARLNGVEISLSNSVTGIETTGDTLSVITERGPIRTKFVVNAAGVYADRIAAMAGVGTFTIKPRKGEEYLLDKRVAGIVKHTIFPCPTPTSKGILVIPTADGTIMVGPTARPADDKEDLSTSPAGLDEVFSAVQALVPAISYRDCIAQFAGLRAVLDTEDFLIGPTSQRGFINVAGIQSPGITAAPAIAVRVVDILRAEGLKLLPNERFAPALPKRIRFAALSRQDQRRLIEADPSYGRIVCRCEQVTEGEVLRAIRAGARTLDGIKFRTRAGMGRCQGGFCTARCMELLAREMNVSLPAITKRGGGSWIAAERVEGN